MQSECGKWFLIYPLFRVTGHLNMLGFERLTFAPKNDVEFWAKVNRHENFGNDWDPNTGCFNDGRGIGFRSEKFHSWLVGAYEGSKQEAKANFRREAQEAMACIFAFSSQKNRRHRVAAIASDDCLMLRSDVSIREYEFSTLGHLYPCYADELELLSIADEVIEWNRLRAILPLASRRRLGTALCFTNLAMSSNDVSTYIFYFIALDALFGERGRVEVSLTEGVSRVCSISRSHEKIGWLFDLRNELIHGGSRYENEWPRYPKYVKHFESKPLLDLEEITLECLRRYPLLQ